MTSTHESQEIQQARFDALLESMQRLTDIEEITQLKAKYFRAVDTKDWDLFANEVLTEDAHFDMEGTLVDGRDEGDVSL